MKNVTGLIQALKQGKAVCLDQNGNWKMGFSLLRDSYDRNLIKSLTTLFDHLEGAEIKKLKPEYLIAADILCQRVKKGQEVTSLYWRVCGARYRLGAGRGGWNKGVREDLLLPLSKLAKEWKRSQKSFWNSALNSRDSALLKRTLRYGFFIELLLQDRLLRERFFVWVLQNGVAPEPFIEFPGACERVICSALCSRIGFYGGELLRIIEKNAEKDLVLPFEGIEQSVLDPNAVIELQGGLSLTVREIFQFFGNKWKRVGKLEFFHDGIRNWNVHQLGWWCPKKRVYDKIDLTRSSWWEQLPPMLQLSKEKASRRFGLPLDGKSWGVVASASREFPTLDYDKSHAYLQLLIPDGENGYHLYSFGKYAFRFPTNFWECVAFFSVSMHATIAYPDDNIFMTERQHGGYSFILNPEQGEYLMQSINEDMRLSRYNHMVFQIETENCGRWIQSLLIDTLGEKNVPNLYRFPLILAEPVGAVGKIFNWLRFLPRRLQGKVLARLHFPFGAWKGHRIRNKEGIWEWKAMTTSSFWDDGIVYLPAFLHVQIEQQHHKTIK